jgi:tetratricopeptide (TPR) repeat protein
MTLPVPELPFLNIDALLATSEPRDRWGGMRMLLGGVALAIVLGWFVGGAKAGTPYSIVGALLMAMLLGVWSLSNYLHNRAARLEMDNLEAIEELIQLRRWPQAAFMVQGFLSRPAISHAARAQALLFLAMVLMRYHRFEDSVIVHEYLLDEIPLDDTAALSVRVGRAMGLLREENLLDADRAISELRKNIREFGAGGSAAAGLALVEIYRDVKTGHPAEAVEIFEERLPVIRKNLGHRVADAWALAARAYDMLGQEEKAREAFANATMLLPLGELKRRYPEISPLSQKYSVAPAPAEMA